MWLSMMLDEDTIAFIVLSGLTIGAALISLETRQVVYGAISLAFSFLGIAGLFIVLQATFVALFQIIVYVGAIAVLIIFTVMVVTKEVESEAKREPFKPLAIAIATIVALSVGIVASLSNLSSTTSAGPSYTVADIGAQLTGTYQFPLVILGLILGASVVGALTLAKSERS
jgi:NADH:ubiquinone oxidoreductase subunit 6 (subunit J)